MRNIPVFVGAKGNYPGLTAILLGITVALALAVVFLIINHHRVTRKARKQSSLRHHRH